MDTLVENKAEVKNYNVITYIVVSTDLQDWSEVPDNSSSQFLLSNFV